MARHHIEGTAFDETGTKPEQILSISRDGKGNHICQTTMLMPQFIYNDSHITLAKNICDTTTSLPDDAFKNVNLKKQTYYPFASVYNHYTCVTIGVKYNRDMLMESVSIDTCEARMAVQYAFGLRENTLRDTPPSVRDIRNLGAKLITNDASATYHKMIWDKTSDMRTNTYLMCDANLASMHYFKELNGKLLARQLQTENKGMLNVAPLIGNDKPSPLYDMFGHNIDIPVKTAEDFASHRQGMRPEYLKMTRPAQGDNLVNFILLERYRNMGPQAVSENDIKIIAARTSLWPKVDKGLR